ncbi:MAG: hypothetical protein LAT84_08735 [Balneolia bacterium]|nr:hypothetical protein [Balneolia bacterium]
MRKKQLQVVECVKEVLKTISASLLEVGVQVFIICAMPVVKIHAIRDLKMKYLTKNNKSVGLLANGFILVLAVAIALLWYYEFIIINYFYKNSSFGFLVIVQFYFSLLFSLLGLVYILSLLQKKVSYILFYVVSVHVVWYIYILVIICDMWKHGMAQVNRYHLGLLIILFMYNSSSQNLDQKVEKYAYSDIEVINKHELAEISDLAFVDAREIYSDLELPIVYKNIDIIRIEEFANNKIKRTKNYVFFCDGVICGEVLSKINKLKREYSFKSFYLVGGL